ncbi:MAG: HIT domain-containing protein [Anaerolineae bacterium]|nr:HIT domain-containing protein [Anaerolineae bacterium]
MRRLWSPWRMQYLTEERPSGCIFCLREGPDRDVENLVLLRGERAFVMLNRYPYNAGHLMVIPYAHVPSLEDLPAETLTELMLLANRCLGALRRAMSPDAFNLGANLGRTAGAGIAEHVHLHVVPRWEGDTNFMPVLAEVRVLPELLQDTYRRLRAALEEQA